MRKLPSATAVVNKYPATFTFFVVFFGRGLFYYLFFPESGWRGMGYGHELGHIARNLSEGLGFSNPFGSSDTPTAFLPPLTPAVLSLVFLVFGVFSQGSLIALYIVQALVGAVCSVCYGLIGAYCVDRKAIRAKVVFVVGLVTAFWPSVLWITLSPWYTIWQECLTAISILAMIVWMRRRQLRYGLVFGISCGVLAYASPVPLPCLFVCGLYGWCRAPAGPECNPKLLKNLCTYAFVWGIVAVVISPWVYRNYVVFGQFIPMRSSFSLELYIGNNHVSPTPSFGDKSLHPYINASELSTYVALGENDYMLAKAKMSKDFIVGEFVDFCVLSLDRITLFWFTDLLSRWENGGTDWTKMGTLRVIRRLLSIGQHLFISVALLLGLFRGWFRQLKYSYIIVVFSLFFPLPYYFTHVSNHYAYPLQMLTLVFLTATLLFWRFDSNLGNRSVENVN